MSQREGEVRELIVTEVIGAEKGRTTYRFNAEDFWLESFRSGVVGGPDVVEAAFTYAKADGYRLPATMERRLLDKDGTARVVGRMTFTEYRPASFPRSTFSLSRFGLPEPQGVTWERPRPTYPYLIAASVGFILWWSRFCSAGCRVGTADHNQW